jgi:acetyl-CoA acetyltransferase
VAKPNGITELFAGLPGWAWPFVALCLFIPVSTLGGAIPVGLGLAGAMGAATLAKDAERSKRTRVALCAGVTALAWAGLAATLLVLRRPQ